MCGIAGIISLDNNLPKINSIKKLTNTMSHRGPDGKGFFVNNKVALGMRRLAIIDVKGGDQPLFNEDKSIVIVGNGEIYNYKELQPKLKKLGHKFRTGSDIEMAVHAYEAWGVNFVKKLRGMFALAIYDIKKQKVILVRDRFGEKPIYLTKFGNKIYFASEMKAIITLPNFKPILSPNSVDKYFHYYYVPEPQTMFENVSKIPKGSFVQVDLTTKRLQTKTYWAPGDIKIKSDTDPTKKIRKEFSQACNLNLVSDVEVGISLSGGIDSGSILAYAAPAYKKTMKAFSIGYEGTPSGDERKNAEKLAKKYKVKFIQKEIKNSEIVDNFPKLVWDTDDPVADIAGYSIYSVSKLAKKHKVKVLLGGAGGDELFWGYPATIEAAKKNTSTSRIFGAITRKKFVYNNPNPETTGGVITKLYTKSFSKKVSCCNIESSKPKNMNKLNIAKHTMTTVQDILLSSYVIAQADRLSMANSVELRSPFLDYKLAEVAVSSKSNIESYNLGTKFWLKKALRGILPDEVINRPKQGFTPPVATWINGITDKYLYLLKDGFLVREGIISKNKIKLLDPLFRHIPMYSTYQLILLEIWGREYVYGQKFNDLK